MREQMTSSTGCRREKAACGRNRRRMPSSPHHGHPQPKHSHPWGPQRSFPKDTALLPQQLGQEKPAQARYEK